MYFGRFLIWILHVLIHHVLVDITAQKRVWPIVDIFAYKLADFGLQNLSQNWLDAARKAAVLMDFDKGF